MIIFTPFHNWIIILMNRANTTSYSCMHVNYNSIMKEIWRYILTQHWNKNIGKVCTTFFFHFCTEICSILKKVPNALITWAQKRITLFIKILFSINFTSLLFVLTAWLYVKHETVNKIFGFLLWYVKSGSKLYVIEFLCCYYRNIEPT